MHTDLISIILCTRDLKNINPLVLPSITSQTYIVRELIIEEGVGNNNDIRNKGFNKSKGEYIFFMDEDIILEPDCLMLLYEQLIRSEADFTYCDYKREGLLEGIQNGRDFNYDRLKIMNYISTMSLMKRSIFPGFDLNINRLQDWDLFLTICERGGIGAWVDKCLFTAIYKEGSISARGNDNWGKSVEVVKRKHGLL